MDEANDERLLLLLLLLFRFIVETAIATVLPRLRCGGLIGWDGAGDRLVTGGWLEERGMECRAGGGTEGVGRWRAENGRRAVADGEE